MLAFALTSVAVPTPTRRLAPPTRFFTVVGHGFPSFLPKQVQQVKDPFARSFAMRIQRIPVPDCSFVNRIIHYFLSACLVNFSENPIMSSCVKPVMQNKANPLVLLHGFDSSCLEWRYAYPLMEEAGFEAWAIDILGWGFSDLENLPLCDVASKRHHFYQFWKSYIRRPMILVGPSLGSAVAIDFAANHPEAVEKLVLIDSSVYAEGTGPLATLPRVAAYAGVYLLKSIPLRLYATYLTFSDVSFSTSLDLASVGRLHCLMPWWEDATVDFMASGGYNVASLIKEVKHKTLILWGENDRIISNRLAVRLHSEYLMQLYARSPAVAIYLILKAPVQLLN
ncbi:alpha/beta hydrolase domain-containing protein VTE7-like [Prosopis cineraria]|uniref:alpha/beta hydrolase domain-containing protein VTE7-like n=1 Tax=Prosopis cineraria TaxID=364024 RepID=UPI002410A136|nr:alpha/beta hydrolase domain-containing protein VTE7-like [Prosopis cineraria]